MGRYGRAAPEGAAHWARVLMPGCPSGLGGCRHLLPSNTALVMPMIHMRSEGCCASRVATACCSFDVLACQCSLHAYIPGWGPTGSLCPGFDGTPRAQRLCQGYRCILYALDDERYPGFPIALFLLFV